MFGWQSKVQNWEDGRRGKLKIVCSFSVLGFFVPFACSHFPASFPALSAFCAYLLLCFPLLYPLSFCPCSLFSSSSFLCLFCLSTMCFFCMPALHLDFSSRLYLAFVQFWRLQVLQLTSERTTESQNRKITGCSTQSHRIRKASKYFTPWTACTGWSLPLLQLR